jgi:hypothetical protein
MISIGVNVLRGNSEVDQIQLVHIFNVFEIITDENIFRFYIAVNVPSIMQLFDDSQHPDADLGNCFDGEMLVVPLH